MLSFQSSLSRRLKDDFRGLVSLLELPGAIALAAQAIPPTATHFSVAWSVCLSVVCHIRALCLNRSMDLGVIWQIQSWGPTAHCVRWGLLTPWGRKDLGFDPQCKHAVANCCCHLANKNEERFCLLPHYLVLHHHQQFIWIKPNTNAKAM